MYTCSRFSRCKVIWSVLMFLMCLFAVKHTLRSYTGLLPCMACLCVYIVYTQCVSHPPVNVTLAHIGVKESSLLFPAKVTPGSIASSVSVLLSSSRTNKHTLLILHFSIYSISFFKFQLFIKSCLLNYTNASFPPKISNGTL